MKKKRTRRQEDFSEQNLVDCAYTNFGNLFSADSLLVDLSVGTTSNLMLCLLVCLRFLGYYV